MAKKIKSKVIIFTDLDGTLLDHKTYSFEKAKPALKNVKQTGTPVVFVTSKTFAEVKVLQKKMSLWEKEAFIIENGGAIFIPKDLFNFNIKNELPKGKITKENRFWKIEFGRPYKEVRKTLKESAKKARLCVIGTGDRTVREFAKITALSLFMAKKAKQRKYQEGFTIENLAKEKLPEAQKRIKKEIEKRGFYMSIGGRFCQISSMPAKIKAVRTLINLFRKKYGRIKTIGLGDAQADLEFINLCHEGYLIKNPKKIAKIKPNKKIKKIKRTGPTGWNSTVLKILCQL